jgi:hypothetical protein
MSCHIHWIQQQSLESAFSSGVSLTLSLLSLFLKNPFQFSAFPLHAFLAVTLDTPRKLHYVELL